ncbi:DNA repair protein endonuclease SAE2/CtIP C-terminus-domain-containing protein [Lasiosphaeria miniovina]|uniref:DNA repair protein endonuclease SAE2/CtIP C-terminus-domain-containing protein n=1 Tax=Lasiosphaeria miniovina TaxID=1954250 RepID=A0AA40B3I4_9PEZI|nr:DNA repair protein endonuclease SAE2/CtIP C-terminus-domain-containing protein [Lasiosphaeria miniovina]KAK0726976.1 DNA repair protein endonuclease SAE2/CtIP C-terminus-domain-containing protein [Lasiosphaeria miniovina]
MDFWNRNAQPAFIAAVQAACDAIGKDLAAEVRDKYQRPHALLEDEVRRLKDAVAKASLLEQQNLILRRQLEELRKKRQHDSEVAPIIVPAVLELSLSKAPRLALAEISANKGAGAGAERSDKENKYAKLAKRFTLLKDNFEKLKAAARSFRDQRDNWIRYANQLETKEKKLRAKLKTRDEGYTPLPNIDTGNATVCDLKARDRSPNSTLSVTVSGARANLVSAIDKHPERTGHISLLSNPETSYGHDSALESWLRKRSASTPEDIADRPNHQQQQLGLELSSLPNDDETTDDAEGFDDLPAIPPNLSAGDDVAVKQEPSSDGPIIIFERSLRKRKHTGADHKTPPRSAKIKSEHENSSDLMITEELAVFSPHESIDLDVRQDIVPTPRKQRPPKEEQIWANNDKEKTGGHRLQDVFGEHPDVTTPGSPTSILQKGARGSIASRSSTKTAVSSGNVSRTYQGRKLFTRLNLSLDSGIADVAEESYPAFYSPQARPSEAEATRLPANGGKLQSLLNEPSSETNSVLLRRGRQGRGSDTGSSKIVSENHTSHTAAVGRATPAPKANRSASKSRPDEGSPRRAKAGRLRDRPATELRTEDFKINPKFNDGYNHAFSEVVRSKADREELLGCTDPDCCGKKFRAMAESELSHGGSAVLLRPADVEMLEKHLGDSAYRLAGMALAEWKELWLKVKTQDMANKYGRHRQRVARRPSPPGFWNPDFPSTQEIDQRKEEAEKIERRLVEDRWREAMKSGGGRWLFRDE